MDDMVNAVGVAAAVVVMVVRVVASDAVDAC